MGGSADRLTRDLLDAELRARAIAGADAVIHLAALPGGADEAGPTLARRVKLDASIGLLEALRGTPVRFVFASTVAVLGDALPPHVADDTLPAPTLLYGAQKAIVETLLATYAQRGWLDADALRPAGFGGGGAKDGLRQSGFSCRATE